MIIIIKVDALWCFSRRLEWRVSRTAAAKPRECAREAHHFKERASFQFTMKEYVLCDFPYARWAN